VKNEAQMRHYKTICSSDVRGPAENSSLLGQRGIPPSTNNMSGVNKQNANFEPAKKQNQEMMRLRRSTARSLNMKKMTC